jgi:hypothetical protein
MKIADDKEESRMSRGKMMFIDNDRRIYSTVEFNGDLYPDKSKGYGMEIVNHFKYGGFKDIYAFERFVIRFDNNHFQYAKEEGIEILKFTKYFQAKGLRIENNLTDYIYIINESDIDIEIYAKDEKVVLPIESMAIIHFGSVISILMRSANIEEVPLDRNEFVRIIDRLRESNELVDKVNKLFRNSRDHVYCDFCNGAGLQISHESLVVKLLEKLMRDQFENISYFIYELQYGKQYESGMVTGPDGDIDLSTPEALYDYLVQEYF